MLTAGDAETNPGKALFLEGYICRQQCCQIHPDIFHEKYLEEKSRK